ncbi:class I glutamine amidotransferase-like protein [Metschnikowia bicuspidata]|uniref:D-lactate dehydratase n=1 Tax=Metschnikowia bicuspidata TaxID=27322 RepID=A0A4P9ZFH7_9ASCO|nr:class I glutamine amidotransferase-like protein [Metschnikowia bicuspidata]
MVHNDPFYGDGAKTGVSFVEGFHPYQEFRKAGIDDDHSIGPGFLQGDDRKVFENADSDFMKAVQHVKKAVDVSAADYDLIFASDSHGTVLDFPHALGLQGLMRTLWEQGKVVASVCHGLSIFENLRVLSDDYLIKGLKAAIGLTDLLEKNIKRPQTVAAECGATFAHPKGPWDCYCLQDGKLVTGVNPQSSACASRKAIALFG